MVHSAKPWNPPTAQLAVWKSYSDKHPKSLRAAWKAVPEPKPSYAIFLKIMNTAFGLSPLQRARQDNKNEQVKKVVKETINNTYGSKVKELQTVQPFKSAPAVPFNNGAVSRNSNSEKAMEIIWSAIRADNMNGDEFKGFVKGLLTGFELK